jgi:signal peptidase I
MSFFHPEHTRPRPIAPTSITSRQGLNPQAIQTLDPHDDQEQNRSPRPIQKGHTRLTTPHPPHHHPGDDSLKETFESVVIAFILAFAFRAYVVEAFVIPTGSMAPTLLGRHLHVACIQCGYAFNIDIPDDNRNALSNNEKTICPMCKYENILPAGQQISTGDRILVHKLIYTLSEPRRWDVIVFKAPHEPNTNYIKRLVGLPNEKLYIFEGNLFVRSSLPSSDDPDWRIARKTRREQAQRAVWQPIYHSAYVPLDQGLPTTPSRRQHPWSVPWRADHPQDWDLQDAHGYRHHTANPGRIAFDFDLHAANGSGQYAYSQIKMGPSPTEPIEDIRLAVAVQPDAPNLFLSLETTSRLDDPQGRTVPLWAAILPDGHAELGSLDPVTHETRLWKSSNDVGPFIAGRTRVVELWYVDQEASLWVDGKRVLVHPFEVPFEVLTTRDKPERHPAVAIQLGGASATLHRVDLDRDLYYSDISVTGQPARGAIAPGFSDTNAPPVTLGPDQFFCLGDNSPWSLDGRYWSKLDEWIEQRMFPDPEDHRPRDNRGIVPRELLIGRAFFVYFPAPLRTSPDAIGIIPNFGSLRFIH